MATKSSVRVVFNNLPKLRAELRPRAGRIVKATALGIETDAKGRVRVDTGQLRGSIHTVMTSDVSATVGTNVAHGPPNEFGTVHMAAQPFMTPAAEAARPRFVAAMRKLLD